MLIHSPPYNPRRYRSRPPMKKGGAGAPPSNTFACRVVLLAVALRLALRGLARERDAAAAALRVARADGADVVLRLAVGRDAPAVLHHRALAGVVARERQIDPAAE